MLWNAFFERVPWGIIILLGGGVAAYQCETFFTPRVDLPARLLYAAYPWKATGSTAVKANTGIVITELVPWTEEARRALRSGEAPLWNRNTGCGSPLLANQQTAIFHPFTLAGLMLPIGKAWTLSVALRLFFLLFFGFIFARQYVPNTMAALYAAAAFGFSTFSIVMLLFPVGLTISALPLSLVAVTEWTRRPRKRSFVVLILAFVLIILSGHPETELMVGIVTGAYALYLSRRVGTMSGALLAVIAAALLTAFFWWPTVALVPFTSRYRLMQAVRSAQIGPRVGAEWTLALLWPNILGTPQAGSYRNPPPVRPDLLNDYGEIASGYAGILSLLLAPFALRKWHGRPVLFFVVAAIVALLTIMELPGWIDLYRRVPVLGLMLHQRVRFLWAFSISILAAVGLANVTQRRSLHVVAIVLLLCDLLATTWRYNPPSLPRDVYPVTGAIAAARNGGRFVALGWSFLPDTPGYYGIEDVKTTDPMQSVEYGAMLRAYLGISPDDYNQEPRDLSHSFVDFLGVRWIYVPPGQSFSRSGAREIYRGADGSVFENTAALPEARFASQYRVDEAFGLGGESPRDIDFSREAILHHVPPQVRQETTWQRQDGRSQTRFSGLGGTVNMHFASRNSSEFAVMSRGWNLLTTNEAWSPAWRVWWNRQRLPVVRVNGAFAGVLTPPGSGSVRFAYRPAEFDRGIVIAAATAIVLIVGIALWRGPLSRVPRTETLFQNPT